MKKQLMALIVLGLTFYSSAQFQSLRSIYWCPAQKLSLPISANFLARAKTSNYTYVFFAVDPVKWAENDYANKFREIDVASKGALHGIPMIYVASKWADDDWGLNDIGQYNGKADTNASGKIHFAKTPPFAYDSVLTAKIRNALKNIAAGYINSSAKNINSHDLEYVVFTHDEPVSHYQILIANGGPDNSRKIMASTEDRDFIESRILAGDSPQLAFRKIAVNEVLQRIQDLEATSVTITINNVKQTSTLSNTKMIMYADMWDPCANGGCLLKATNFQLNKSKSKWDPANTTICFAPDVAGATDEIVDLPGLSAFDAAKVRQKVVLAPWCYSDAWCWNTPRCIKYDANKTFKYFTDHGFKFIYVSASNDAADHPTTQENLDAIHSYVSSSMGYRNNCIGYNAAIWTGGAPITGDWDDTKGMYSQTRNFDIIEYLYKMNFGPQDDKAPKSSN
jgi:hypothetical protein